MALVEGCDRLAVHRTYLRPDGTGKAEVEPQKAMLGATAGGAVTLQEGAGRLVVAEGIENRPEPRQWPSAWHCDDLGGSFHKRNVGAAFARPCGPPDHRKRQ